jgi:hypothetical protein
MADAGGGVFIFILLILSIGISLIWIFKGKGERATKIKTLVIYMLITISLSVVFFLVGKYIGLKLVMDVLSFLAGLLFFLSGFVVPVISNRLQLEKRT